MGDNGFCRRESCIIKDVGGDDMSEKRNKASNEIVLGYWQALDFMHVGSFPGSDDALGDGWCVVEAQLHGEDDLLVLLDDKLQEEVLSARKTTVFLGSVDRDWCISMLAGKLGNASENMGFSDDSKVTIALMSFQLDESHKFIAGTYRLAPVIYATIRLEDDAEIGSSAFNVKSYLSDMRNMERRFFSNDPVDMAQLSKLYDMLAEQDEHYHDRVSCVLSTLDDVPGPFPGLGDQGFGEDIAYLLKPREGTRLNYHVNDYIRAPMGEADVSRDILGEMDFDERYDVFHDLFSSKNIAMGKWPSGDGLPLMDMIALSGALRSGARNAVFAVNAPYGTGKAEIVQEIVADFVVKKARVLTRHEHADDAFEDRVTNGIHALRRSDLGDYAIVVSSLSETSLKEIVMALSAMHLDDEDDEGYGEKIRGLFQGEMPLGAFLKDKVDLQRHVSAVLANNEASDIDYDAMYTNARNAFVKQYYRVAGMRDALRGEQDKIGELVRNCREYLPEKVRMGSLLDICRALEKELSGARTKARDVIAGFEAQKEDYMQQVVAQRNLAKSYMEEAEDMLGSINFKTKLLRRSEYDEAVRKREECLAKAQEAQAKCSEIESFIPGVEKEIATMRDIFGRQRRLLDACDAVKDILRKHDRGLDKYVGGQPAILADLFGEDETKRAQAHGCTPWISKRFDYERMILLGLALRLNKYFVLSSRYLRKNLETMHDKPGVVAPEMLFLTLPVACVPLSSIGTLFPIGKGDKVFGKFIVMDGYNAQPYMALGGLLRSNSMLVFGDEGRNDGHGEGFMRQMWTGKISGEYLDDSATVAGFASRMTGESSLLGDRHIGSPLVVSRHGVSPMFEIINEVSYEGRLIKATSELDVVDEANGCSRWIQTVGAKDGHVVKEQEEATLVLLENAFAKTIRPDILVVSPFASVVESLKKSLAQYMQEHPESNIVQEYTMQRIVDMSTYVGSGAAYVVAVLGCDGQDDSAIKSIDAKVVSAMASLAGKALYVVGDIQCWKACEPMEKMWHVLNAYLLSQLQRENLDEKTRNGILAVLPTGDSFIVHDADHLGVEDSEIATDAWVMDIKASLGAMEMPLEQAKVEELGYESMAEIQRYPQKLKDNLICGVRLMDLLEPYRNEEMDASICGALLSCALEEQMRRCFVARLKQTYPHTVFRHGNRSIEIIDSKDDNYMIGTLEKLLKHNKESLAKRTGNLQEWDGFLEKLSRAAEIRNLCCASEPVSFELVEELCRLMFKDSMFQGKNPREILSEGLMFKAEDLGERIVTMNQGSKLKKRR